MNGWAPVGGVILVIMMCASLLSVLIISSIVSAGNVPSLVFENVLHQYYNFSSEQMRWWFPLPDGIAYRMYEEILYDTFVLVKYYLIEIQPNGTIPLVGADIVIDLDPPSPKGSIDDVRPFDAVCNQYGCAITYCTVDWYPDPNEPILEHYDYYYTVTARWYDGRYIDVTIGPFTDYQAYGGAWDIVAIGHDYIVVQGRYTVLSQPMIYVFSDNGSYYSFNLSRTIKASVYSYRIEGAIYGDKLLLPILTNETPSNHITLYAINLTTGKVIWTSNIDSVNSVVNVEQRNSIVYIVENPDGNIRDIVDRYNMEHVHIFNITSNEEYESILYGDHLSTFYPSWDAKYLTRPDNDYSYGYYRADFFYWDKYGHYYNDYKPIYTDSPVIRSAVSGDGRVAVVATSDNKVYAYYFSDYPGWNGAWVLFGESDVNGTVIFINMDPGGRYVTVLTEVKHGACDYAYHVYVFKVSEMSPGRLDPPILEVPRYIRKGANLTINWTRVLGADRYRVEIDVFPDFASPQVYFVNTTSLMIDTTPLSVGETYYVRVRAESTTDKIYGSWSDIKSFTVYTLYETDIEYPLNDTLVVDGDNVVWRPSIVPDDIGSYEVQISKDKEFNNIVDTATVNDTSYKVNLEPGKYYVRVRPVVGNDHGNWSEPVEITIVPKTVLPRNTPIKNVRLLDGGITGDGEYVIALVMNLTDFTQYLMIFVPNSNGFLVNTTLTELVPMPGAEMLACGKDVFAVYFSESQKVRVYKYSGGALHVMYEYLVPSTSEVVDMAVIGNDTLMLVLYDYYSYYYSLEVVELSKNTSYTVENLYSCNIAGWKEYGVAYIENVTGTYLLLFNDKGEKVSETEISIHGWEAPKIRFGEDSVTITISGKYIVYSLPNLTVIETSDGIGESIDDALHFHNYTVYITGGVVVFPHHRVAIGESSTSGYVPPYTPSFGPQRSNTSLVLGSISVVAVSLKSDEILLVLLNESNPIIFSIPGTYGWIIPSSTYSGDRIAIIASGSLYVYVLNLGASPSSSTLQSQKNTVIAGNTGNTTGSLGGSAICFNGTIILACIILAIFSPIIIAYIRRKPV